MDSDIGIECFGKTFYEGDGGVGFAGLDARDDGLGSIDTFGKISLGKILLETSFDNLTSEIMFGLSGLPFFAEFGVFEAFFEMILESIYSVFVHK